jgi:hypothetical protein
MKNGGCRNRIRPEGTRPSNVFRNPIPTSEILLADCGLAWLESGELSEGEKSMKQRIVLMLVFVLSLTALTWGQ